MMSHETTLQKAERHYDAAYYLLNVTLPAVKDSKLMLGIMENIFNSLESAMIAALLHTGKTCPENFGAKLALFQEKFAGDSTPDFDSLIEIKNIRELHQKTSIEFRRGDSFVLCHKDYRMKPLTTMDVAKHLKNTEKILGLVRTITSQDRKN